jgi:hypothetical protein
LALILVVLAPRFIRAEAVSHPTEASSGFSVSFGQEPTGGRSLREAGFWLFTGATGELGVFSEPTSQQGHAWGLGISLGLSVPIWAVFPEAGLKARFGYSPDYQRGVLELAPWIGAAAVITRRWAVRAHYEWVVSTLESSRHYELAGIGLVYLFP